MPVTGQLYLSVSTVWFLGSVHVKWCPIEKKALWKLSPLQVLSLLSYKRNIIILMPSVRKKDINYDFIRIPSDVNASCTAFYSTDF